MENKYCIFCGTKISAQAIFCIKCGKKQPEKRKKALLPQPPIVEGETVKSKIRKQQPKDVGGAEAYTNKKLGFSIVPPKGWNIFEPDFGVVIPAYCGSVVFYAPEGNEIKEVDDLDGLLSDGVPHIKIIVMETDAIMKAIKVDDPETLLDKIAEESEKGVGPTFGVEINLNRKIESKRKRTIDDLDAHELVSTIESEAEDIASCKAKDLTIVEKSMLYSITFTVREKDYDRYLPVFEKTIHTFQVDEQAGVEPLKQTMKDRGLGFAIDPPEGWMEFPHKLLTDIGVFTIFYTTTEREKLVKLEKLGNASQIGNVEVGTLGRILNDVPHIKILVNKTDMSLDEVSAKIAKIPRTSTVSGDLPGTLLTKTVLSDQRITINDLDTYEQVYTLEDSNAVYKEFLKALSTHPGKTKPQSTPRKVKEFCFVERGRLYDVALSTPKKAYETYLPDFERSIQTFHVMKSGGVKGKVRRDEHALAEMIKGRDEKRDARMEAVDTLGKIRDTGAVEPLIQILKDENKAPSAMVALKRIGEPAIEPLIKALKHENIGIRWGATITLGKLGKPAVEPLIQALKDKDKEVRKGAARALAEIGDAKAAEPLNQILNDEDLLVRVYAQEGLDKIKAKKS